jgi:hypothetical protein
MYTDKNFITKKALKDQVAAYNAAKADGDEEKAARLEVTIYAPGLGSPKRDGTDFVEGPHYPKPHTWYAQVTMQNGVVVKVK